MPNRALAVDSAAVPSASFAVFGGVVTALAAHIVLNMIGVGIGAVTVPYLTDPGSFNWSAFAWWAVVGIIAAFCGGYATGALVNAADAQQAGVLAFIAWGTTLILVILFLTVSAGATASILANVGGPAATMVSQMQETQLTAAQAEAARQSLAIGSLASVIALLIGAAASVIGGGWAVGGTTFRRRAGART